MENDNKGQKESEKKEQFELNSVVVIAIFGAIVAIFIVVGAYRLNFSSNLFSSKTAVWGAFGDYIGGVLNPMFGFITIMILLYTVYQQSKELRKSTKALEYQSKEMQHSTKALENQSKEMKNSVDALAAQKKEMEEARKVTTEQLEHIQKQSHIDTQLKLCQQIYEQIQKELLMPIDLWKLSNGNVKILSDRTTTLEKVITEIYFNFKTVPDLQTKQEVEKCFTSNDWKIKSHSSLQLRIERVRVLMNLLFKVLKELKNKYPESGKNEDFYHRSIFETMQVFEWAEIFNLDDF